MTPILWNIDNVSSPQLKFILKLNPINYFVEGYRDIFLYKKWFFISNHIYILYLPSKNHFLYKNISL